MRFLLLVLILLGLPVEVPAGRAQALQEPRFESLGEAGAVADSVITSLAQDARGFLWLGGPGGLLRYDGYQMREFRISDGQQRGASIVRSILAARDGSIWVARDGAGLARLDPDSGRFTLFRPDAAQPDSLSPGSVRALAEDGAGRLWIGTLGGGLDRYDPATQRFRHFRSAAGLLPDDRVQSLLLDSRGELWVGTWSGLARCSPQAERCTPVFSAAGQALAGQIVSMLGDAGDGRIWAGTRDGSLFVIDTASGSGRWLDRKGDGALHAMQRLDGDQVWVARSTGIEQRDADDGRLLRRLRHDVRKPWSLRHNDVSSLLRDRSGWLWIGSYGGGLQRHRPDDAGLWVRRAEPEGVLAEADVRSLLTVDREIWLGTAQAGVAVLDADLLVRGEIRAGAHGLADGAVGAMTRDARGGIWLAVDGQLNLFDAARRRLAHWQVSQGRIRRLLATSDGRLWIATQDGLYRLDARDAQPLRVLRSDGETLYGNVNALTEAGGRIWVGGDAGLFHVEPGGTALQALPRALQEAMSELPVLGLLEAGAQQLWVDSNAGLFRLQTDADGRPLQLQAIGREHGLGEREFGANLLQDAEGRLWTQRGFFDPRDGSHYRLTAADGADIGTGWFRSYTALPDGRLLFGGSTGLLVLEPARFRPWRAQPPLVATELRIDGRPVPLPGERLLLQPGQRSFALEFAALDFSSPMRNRYRYRLEGLDADWTEVGASARVLGYGNLAPGDYRLRVQGSNRVGDWSPHELQLALRVLPAWWQTWWARSGGLLLLAAAMFTLVQARTLQLRRRQVELEAKVRERTVELEDASLTDPLTGLRNRRFLHQHIGADTGLAIRRHEDRASGHEAQASDLIFFLIDIDHFKRINDQHGHAAGDAVIQQMRERLQPVFRDSDHLVRWGGEEFLIVARDTDRGHAPELAERVRQAVAGRSFDLGDGRLLDCSCSLGFACFPPAPSAPRALDWDQCLRLADAALYDAKQRGRNAWTGLMEAAQPLALPPAEWLGAPGVRTLRS